MFHVIGTVFDRFLGLDLVVFPALLHLVAARVERGQKQRGRRCNGDFFAFINVPFRGAVGFPSDDAGLGGEKLDYKRFSMEPARRVGIDPGRHRIVIAWSRGHADYGIIFLRSRGNGICKNVRTRGSFGKGLGHGHGIWILFMTAFSPGPGRHDLGGRRSICMRRVFL